MFPGVISFEDRVFRKKISFNNATFTGDAIFWRTTFEAEASFYEATFKQDAVFHRAEFYAAVRFYSTVFKAIADFTGAIFSQRAIFYRATFVGDVSFHMPTFSNGATFRGISLNGALTVQGDAFAPYEVGSSVEFTNLTRDTASRIRFEGTNLSQVSFLRTDVSQMHFVGCKWAQKQQPLLWPIPIRRPIQNRTAIFDELGLDLLKEDEDDLTFDLPEEDDEAKGRRLVAALYRQLRINYESNLQEAEAGHFYIGQMEMRRRDKSYPRLQRWFILPLYRVLAMYGESYARPVFWYLVLGALFALAYLWIGFQVGGDKVEYGFGLDWRNTWPFLKHFLRAWVQALSAGGILGANLAGLSGLNLASGSWWVPLVRYTNMLVDTFLVGFFVITPRRHFRR